MNDIEQLKADIESLKKKLIAKAKVKGIWENFGQEEEIKLKAKYDKYNPEVAKMINEFDEWASGFTMVNKALATE